MTGKIKLLFLIIYILPFLSCEIEENIEDSNSNVDIIEEETNNTTLTDSITEYIVFSRKKGLRPVFRIPSLLITQKGTLLISCENRNIVADKGEIDILIARKDTANSDWQYQTVFTNDSAKGRVMNPIFLQDIISNRIYLFAARLANKDKFATDHSTKEMDCVYKYSDDDGVSWSDEISLKSKWDIHDYSGSLPSASNGIQASNGTLYVPTMVVKNNNWYSGLLTKNKGKDWYFSIATPNAGDNESTVYIDNENRVVLDCRTFNGVRNKYYYDENKNIYINAPDNIITSIVDLKAEITKCGLSGKTIYLMSFSNTKSNKRENLSLFASKDGINWIFIHLLEKGPNRFSYSNVSCYNDKIYVVYETETCIKLKDISLLKNDIIRKVFGE